MFLNNKSSDPLRMHNSDRTGDAAAGTFGVRLELANPDGLVPAGVKCQVTLQSGTPTQATQDEPATRTATPIAAIQ